MWHTFAYNHVQRAAKVMHDAKSPSAQRKHQGIRPQLKDTYLGEHFKTVESPYSAARSVKAYTPAAGITKSKGIGEGFVQAETRRLREQNGAGLPPQAVLQRAVAGVSHEGADSFLLAHARNYRIANPVESKNIKSRSIGFPTDWPAPRPLLPSHLHTRTRMQPTERRTISRWDRAAEKVHQVGHDDFLICHRREQRERAKVDRTEHGPSAYQVRANAHGTDFLMQHARKAAAQSPAGRGGREVTNARVDAQPLAPNNQPWYKGDASGDTLLMSNARKVASFSPFNVEPSVPRAAQPTTLKQLKEVSV